jgi:DNA modification methylase
MLAFALRADGWYLRQDIIWHKPNPMPESVTDRCTRSHEYIFLLSKSGRYFFDHQAIQTDTQGAEHDKRARAGRKTFPTELINGIRTSGYYPKANKRDVWTVCTAPEKEAHFACFPQKLIVDCIKAGCPEGGTVLDPFMGSGTAAVVARKLNRNYVGFELNPQYMKIAHAKLHRELGLFV